MFCAAWFCFRLDVFVVLMLVLLCSFYCCAVNFSVLCARFGVWVYLVFVFVQFVYSAILRFSGDCLLLVFAVSLAGLLFILVLVI